jgi:hypothetical protein
MEIQPGINSAVGANLSHRITDNERVMIYKRQIGTAKHRGAHRCCQCSIKRNFRAAKL